MNDEKIEPLSDPIPENTIKALDSIKLGGVTNEE